MDDNNKVNLLPIGTSGIVTLKIYKTVYLKNNTTAGYKEGHG